jgi:hypothetical protein
MLLMKEHTFNMQDNRNKKNNKKAINTAINLNNHRNFDSKNIE